MMILDPLYGDIQFDRTLSDLIRRPIVQRLRHVRLSNVDSLDLPGIAHISRYEHVLGTAHLAGITRLAKRLAKNDLTIVCAAAVLHDWAISAFGHLIEEAFRYVGFQFDHQDALFALISGEDPSQLGGAQRQILCGRQTQLRDWAVRVFGSKGVDEALFAITESIRGRAERGALISGSIDLDNIDNVYRSAFHMGLVIDRLAPHALAQAIVDCKDGHLIFAGGSEYLITRWMDTRRTVYDRFMLAEQDFAGKVMLVYATVEALRLDEFSRGDWSLTDVEFIHALTTSKSKHVRDTIERWLCGELWSTTPLYWMKGDVPSYGEMMSFSTQLTELLSRTCFAYRIADKRARQVHAFFDDGTQKIFGSPPTQWLFGVGSPLKREFSAAELHSITQSAKSVFGASDIQPASRPRIFEAESKQMGLL